MDRRVFGIENEYGITWTLNGRRQASTDDLARRMFRPLTLQFDGSNNAFLRNGARFYIDTGSHPEYASAECDSVPQLIAHDKAGDRLVEALSIAAEARMRAQGKEGDFYVFKNNTDSAGNSYGTHENYLVERDRPAFESLTDALMPFLATRHMIAGAGKLVQTPVGSWYCFAQRPEHMSDTVASATTRMRAIISTKDEPHADMAFRRLHVIVGDANMAEPTMLLKVGATDLVLRMIEDGADLPALALQDPVASLQAINCDLTGRTPVPLADGRSTSALALQQAYLGAARTYAEHRGIDGDRVVARVLELWGRTLEAIARQDFSLIDHDIDWAIKLKLMTDYGRRRNLPLTSARMGQIDLGYHDVRRTRGLYHRLLNRGMVHRVITDLDIMEASALPPQTTRAKLRGDFLRWAQETSSPVVVDWTRLTLRGTPTRTVMCGNPLSARDDRVAALMRPQSSATAASSL